MRHLKSYNESASEKLKSMLDRSSDWEKIDSISPFDQFSLIYRYRYSKSKKWDYLIGTLGYGNYCIYLFYREDESFNFLGYLDTPISSLHRRLYKFDTPLNAAIKFLEIQQNVFDFFDSLPDEEIIDEWFTYLTDSFKISSIDIGFIDWDSESNFYKNIDSNSGPAVICVSFDDENINKNGLDISNYGDKQDYKKNKTFVENNPEFMSELSSVINRTGYYLGDNYKYYRDYKIYISSWGVRAVIELYKTFE